jgi:hypothetical protein
MSLWPPRSYNTKHLRRFSALKVRAKALSAIDVAEHLPTAGPVRLSAFDSVRASGMVLRWAMTTL